MRRILLPALLALVMLTGCASTTAEGPGDTASPSEPTAAAETPTEAPEPIIDLATVVETVRSGVPEATEVVDITEDNDPNDLIGRPNGYVGGAVFYDSRLACDDLSVDCGATLEEWPDEAAAQERSDYIQGLLAETPAFGSEYHYLVDGFLLRVNGDLKPSEAEAYEAAIAAVSS